MGGGVSDKTKDYRIKTTKNYIRISMFINENVRPKKTSSITNSRYNNLYGN